MKHPYTVQRKKLLNIPVHVCVETSLFYNNFNENHPMSECYLFDKFTYEGPILLIRIIYNSKQLYDTGHRYAHL